MLTESSERTAENGKPEKAGQPPLQAPLEELPYEVSPVKIAAGHLLRRVSILKAVDPERWKVWGAKRRQEERRHARRDQVKSEVVLAVLAVASLIYWLLW